MATKKKESGSKAAAASNTVSCKIRNLKGEEVGALDLDAEIFGAEINEALVFDAVQYQLTNRRAGTHSVLTKGVMKGGGRKPWRQKGTGRARAGSNTSPLWVGGAVAHGPKPHDYTNRMAKRSRKQALSSVLTSFMKEGRILVIDSLETKKAKTKDIAKAFDALGISGKKVLMVFSGKGGEFEKSSEARSSRNIADVIQLSAEGVNVFDLLRSRILLGTKESILSLQDTVKGRGSEKKAESAKA